MSSFDGTNESAYCRFPRFGSNVELKFRLGLSRANGKKISRRPPAWRRARAEDLRYYGGREAARNFGAIYKPFTGAIDDAPELLSRCGASTRISPPCWRNEARHSTTLGASPRANCLARARENPRARTPVIRLSIITGARKRDRRWRDVASAIRGDGKRFRAFMGNTAERQSRYVTGGRPLKVEKLREQDRGRPSPCYQPG